MGFTYDTTIERAALFLLRLLEERGGELPYSTFYDGTNETSEWLERNLELSEGDGAEGAMDLAASQLEGQGVVRLAELQSDLADGFKDYSIALTDKGRSWFKKPFKLVFHTSE